MAKTLQLSFTTAEGKQTSLNVDEPKDGLTPVEVETAVQQIISSGVFEVDGSPLQSFKGARIIDRQVTELVKV